MSAGSCSFPPSDASFEAGVESAEFLTPNQGIPRNSGCGVHIGLHLETRVMKEFNKVITRDPDAQSRARRALQ